MYIVGFLTLGGGGVCASSRGRFLLPPGVLNGEVNVLEGFDGGCGEMLTSGTQ